MSNQAGRLGASQPLAVLQCSPKMTRVGTLAAGSSCWALLRQPQKRVVPGRLGRGERKPRWSCSRRLWMVPPWGTPAEPSRRPALFNVATSTQQKRGSYQPGHGRASEWTLLHAAAHRVACHCAHPDGSSAHGIASSLLLPQRTRWEPNFFPRFAAPPRRLPPSRSHPRRSHR